MLNKPTVRYCLSMLIEFKVSQDFFLNFKKNQTQYEKTNFKRFPVIQNKKIEGKDSVEYLNLSDLVEESIFVKHSILPIKTNIKLQLLLGTLIKRRYLNEDYINFINRQTYDQISTTDYEFCRKANNLVKFDSLNMKIKNPSFVLNRLKSHTLNSDYFLYNTVLINALVHYKLHLEIIDMCAYKVKPEYVQGTSIKAINRYYDYLKKTLDILNNHLNLPHELIPSQYIDGYSELTSLLFELKQNNKDTFKTIIILIINNKLTYLINTLLLAKHINKEIAKTIIEGQCLEQIEEQTIINKITKLTE